jgi:hypothetical protein
MKKLTVVLVWLSVLINIVFLTGWLYVYNVNVTPLARTVHFNNMLPSFLSINTLSIITFMFSIISLILLIADYIILRKGVRIILAMLQGLFLSFDIWQLM